MPRSESRICRRIRAILFSCALSAALLLAARGVEASTDAAGETAGQHRPHTRAAAIRVNVTLNQDPSQQSDKLYTKRRYRPMPLRAGEPMPPLVFMSGPCMGSTAVQTVARAMLQAHNIWPDDWVHWEELRADKNRMVKKARVRLPEAVSIQLGLAQSRGKAFFTKLEPYTGMDTKELLVSRGARVVNVWRSNALDVAACNIRDCFMKRLGRPILPNGTGTGLCFKRRWLESAPMAHLYVGPGLERELRGFLSAWRFQLHVLRKAGFRRFQTVTSEALMGFGASAELLPRSVRAWHTFLGSLGVRPVNASAVAAVLQDGRCGRDCTVGARPLRPHSSTIWNFDEVKRALLGSGNPRLYGLLRE